MPLRSGLVLNSASKKFCFAAACIAITTAYLQFTTKQFWAWQCFARNTPAGLAEAARLQPSNAEYHAKLGRLVEAGGNIPAAEEEYQAALHLNSFNAHYWLDQAGIFERNGKTEGQRRAIEHAIDADPRTPEIAWRAANFYLVQGYSEAALRQLHSVLEGDPDRAPTVLDLAWRATHDVNRLLAEVLPGQQAAHLALLDVLASYHETNAAQNVWSHLIGMERPVKMRLALSYVDYLIEQREIASALAAWNQLATLDRLPGYLSSPNLIVNGGFDAEILNAGFDWKYYRQDGVHLSLDETVFHGGRRGLAISFLGGGIDDVKIFHLIPLSPNTTYSFSTYFRTGELEGAGGPKIVITDAYSAQEYFVSDDLKNAGVWRQINGRFTTADNAKLAVLKIVRLPEGHPIRGMLWLDDMELTKK